MVAKTRTHKALCFPPKDCISYLKMLWECAVHLEGFEIWGGGGQTECIMGGNSEKENIYSKVFPLRLSTATLKNLKKKHNSFS